MSSIRKAVATRWSYSYWSSSFIYQVNRTQSHYIQYWCLLRICRLLIIPAFVESMPTINILLVEDEKTFVQIVNETLRSKGFTVETAYDGAEGLKRFFEIHPDVLIADVMMPRMDGFEMVRRSGRPTTIPRALPHGQIHPGRCCHWLRTRSQLLSQKTIRHPRTHRSHQGTDGKSLYD